MIFRADLVPYNINMLPSYLTVLWTIPGQIKYGCIISAKALTGVIMAPSLCFVIMYNVIINKEGLTWIVPRRFIQSFWTTCRSVSRYETQSNEFGRIAFMFYIHKLVYWLPSDCNQTRSFMYQRLFTILAASCQGLWSVWGGAKQRLKSRHQEASSNKSFGASHTAFYWYV